MSYGLYIHIPFCKYICKYCDFCKKFVNTYDHTDYVEALIFEMDFKITDFSQIKTIYIGGGTPSALDEKALILLLNYLSEKINMKNIIEYTFEANPDDIKTKLVKILNINGINRISLGVQTLNDEILKDVGRLHTKQDVVNSLEIIHPIIKNISLDLIFNLPNQTFIDIEDTFNFISKYSNKINHISYYSLILENNTIFKFQEIENFNEDEEDIIYKLIQSKLKTLGYHQYEISNYSKENKESIHNLNYWNGSEYFGIGIGASQYFNKIRSTNTKSIKKYVENINNGFHEQIIFEKENINDKEEVYETIMLCLRTKFGISKKFVEENNLKLDEEYIEETNFCFRIKAKYLFLSNNIIIELLEQL